MQSSKVWSFVAASAAMVAAQAMGQQAVEWKVSEGGNGHWYRFIRDQTVIWNSAVDRSVGVGGHLATINSASENAFIFTYLNSSSGFVNERGPFVGGYQDRSAPDFSEPRGGWRWVTGEPWLLSNWDLFGFGEPNNVCGCSDSEDILTIDNRSGVCVWNDSPGAGQYRSGYLIEWEADCNADGIVDYGQILSGELTDTNSNGVPDCCEDGSVCSTSLILNSSFESGSPLNACAVESVSAGNLVASGWQVSAGVVDRMRGGTTCASATQPRFGDYCVDLCGTPASSGAIKQLVPTVPGHKYRCTFWLSGDASAGPSTKKVHAKVGTYIDLGFTFACSGTGAQNWVSNQFEFTARGANEPLEFVADNGVTTGGPMLDAINLVDITTQCVGDLDASGQVDGADISLLLLNFGDCPVGP